MNDQIFLFFYGLAHKSEAWDSVIVFLAHTFPYIIIALAGIFLLLNKKRLKNIITVGITGFLAWLLSYLLKNVIESPRPFAVLSDVTPLFEKTDYSFPSGHATFFMALAVSIFYVNKKAGYLFMAAALIIGIARVAAGVHSPLDILGGFAIGALAAYIIRRFI